MVNQGHFICDICFQYIRPNRGDKLVNHKAQYGYSKGGKLITIGHTKAHRDCLEGHSPRLIKMVMEYT